MITNLPNNSVITYITKKMDYKIGDKFHVIIKGFSPTIARIDNITHKNGETFYHISFLEEHMFTIAKMVSEQALLEMIALYERNKNNLEPFMMKGKNPNESGISEIEKDSDAEIITEVEVKEEDRDISSEGEVDFNVKKINQKESYETKT